MAVDPSKPKISRDDYVRIAGLLMVGQDHNRQIERAIVAVSSEGGSVVEVSDDLDDEDDIPEREQVDRHAASLRSVALRIGDLLGRRVELVLHLRILRTLTVRQKCRVCRADVEANLPEGKTELDTIAVAGAAARKAYITHECPSVERSLHGFTWPELEELRQSLERDSIRLAERVAEIERLEKGRGS